MGLSNRVLRQSRGPIPATGSRQTTHDEADDIDDVVHGRRGECPPFGCVAGSTGLQPRFRSGGMRIAWGRTMRVIGLAGWSGAGKTPHARRQAHPGADAGAGWRVSTAQARPPRLRHRPPRKGQPYPTRDGRGRATRWLVASARTLRPDCASYGARRGGRPPLGDLLGAAVAGFWTSVKTFRRGAYPRPALHPQDPRVPRRLTGQAAFSTDRSGGGAPPVVRAIGPPPSPLPDAAVPVIALGDVRGHRRHPPCARPSDHAALIG